MLYQINTLSYSLTNFPHEGQKFTPLEARTLSTIYNWFKNVQRDQKVNCHHWCAQGTHVWYHKMSIPCPTYGAPIAQCDDCMGASYEENDTKVVIV